jgi:tryptophanyl-tRNA synthetase
LAGLLNYPILQAADVLLYKADTVPVGEDQVQHIELMREIVRKWSARFGAGFFPEPESLLTGTRRIVGLDGQAKMSKSLDNTIGLLEEPDEIWQHLRPAVTDPARVTKRDPGNPEVCNIYSLHRHFSPGDTVEEVARQCRSAGWGCLDCKRVLADQIAEEFAPMRERARELQSNPTRVHAILEEGARRAQYVARETMREVRERMGFLRAKGAARSS